MFVNTKINVVLEYGFLYIIVPCSHNSDESNFCLACILLNSLCNLCSWGKWFFLTTILNKTFHVLEQLLFTISEPELVYHHQKVNAKVVSRIVEQLKTRIEQS